ncbi:NAD(P)/FAD-dependent oxidoreductase [Endozoicomonas atrinae]|uniref:NAD(P)/FAD-dependent oxidoreductase n=1 Tax=Endozoicomonas atrinae TaxID=1333660 RepID=UPI000A63FE81|nr:FAD-binding oxidoreductase [Endozoicomonas atrinae]
MVTSSPVHTEEHACSWYAATANRQTNYPALKGKVKADVCIVGGGFSGVGTALALAEKGYRVVVLEARKIAWGATGRSGGQLIRGLGESPERYQLLIGREGVEAINRMGFESVERVRSIISRYRIQCDLQMGYLDAALKQRHMTSLAGELDLLKQQGYPHRLRLLQSSELSKVIGSSRYIGGLVDEGSGHLHPMNLCLGEVDAAEKLGVLFY